MQSASTVVFLLLALGSAVVYGVGDWFGGRAARHQASLVVVVVGQAVSLVLVAAATGLGDAGSPDTSTWLWSAAGGVIGALGIVSLYHGFATGAVTVVAPVSAVVSAVVPVAGGLLIGERPSGLALAGMFMAWVVGWSLANADRIPAADMRMTFVEKIHAARFRRARDRRRALGRIRHRDLDGPKRAELTLHGRAPPGRVPTRGRIQDQQYGHRHWIFVIGYWISEKGIGTLGHWSLTIADMTNALPDIQYPMPIVQFQ